MKEVRVDVFREKAQASSEVILINKIGKVMDVIVDEVDADGIATSRTKAYAPEIDGNLFIDQNAIGLKPGDIVKVKVDKASDYNLWGHRLL